VFVGEIVEPVYDRILLEWEAAADVQVGGWVDLTGSEFQK
jgi:hypothetical protein